MFARCIRLRCPQCGRGRIYERWNVVARQCPACGLDLRRREGDAWFVNYMLTGTVTGVILIAMFLIHATDYLIGQIAVAVAWLLLMIPTIPLRKAIALGFDVFIDQRTHARDGSPRRQEGEP